MHEIIFLSLNDFVTKIYYTLVLLKWLQKMIFKIEKSQTHDEIGIFKYGLKSSVKCN